MTTGELSERKLARELVQDELFDLSLYQGLERLPSGRSVPILEDLIQVERKHVAFLQGFFNLPDATLDWGRRLKLHMVLLCCRLFGETAIHLVLEATEVHGVRQYLALWYSYRDRPLGTAIRNILHEEFQHEAQIVSGLVRQKINPERIRNIFFGLNDGLVEILGAVSGFFGAFGDAVTVLIAGLTTAVAGSISMGAGAYVALSSEKEVRRLEQGKQQFLEGGEPPADEGERPLGSSFLVGISYFGGALVPIVPILLGGEDAWGPLIAAGTLIIVVSAMLAFLSGMDIKKRVFLNVGIIAAAVGITYTIGLIARNIWGIEV